MRLYSFGLLCEPFNLCFHSLYGFYCSVPSLSVWTQSQPKVNVFCFALQYFIFILREKSQFIWSVRECRGLVSTGGQIWSKVSACAPQKSLYCHIKELVIRMRHIWHHWQRLWHHWQNRNKHWLQMFDYFFKSLAKVTEIVKMKQMRDQWHSNARHVWCVDFQTLYRRLCDINKLMSGLLFWTEWQSKSLFVFCVYQWAENP